MAQKDKEKKLKRKLYALRKNMVRVKANPIKLKAGGGTRNPRKKKCKNIKKRHVAPVEYEKMRAGRKKNK